MPRTRLLRLSVTDRCNFRCRYCMPLSGIVPVPRDALLSLEQLGELVSWLSRQTTIERVKLTGGEPLVRPGLGHLVRLLAAIPGVHEISMTTNGSLLAGQAAALKAAGLARVSVSIDSLDPVRFAALSRGGRLAGVLDGIDAALAAGLGPVKLNTVLQRSTWRDDLPMILDFAVSRGLRPRFIELMRTGTERAWCTSEFVAVSEVREWLEAQARVVVVPSPLGAPARETRVNWGGTDLAVGWITPRSVPFCSACERVRLDARGRLRRCLMDRQLLDLAEVRRARGDRAATDAFHAYMAGKHIPVYMDSEAAMSQIGG